MKQQTRLTVTCRYPISKEYIMLLIIDQEMVEIAFTLVAPPGYSLELYIDASVKTPPI